MCECCEGGGGGGGLNVCVSRHTIPLDVAAYGKLLTRRQGLILRQGHLKAYHRQACWKQLKSGQASRGRGLEGEGQPVPCPPPEVNLHISCNLKGIIWIRMIGKAQQIHELSMSISF